MDYIYQPAFGTRRFLFQIPSIVLQSVIFRFRYYVIFSMGDILSVISDIRNKYEDYNCHKISIRYQNIEMSMAPRVKVANWNISIANWLREAFYQRFQNINLKNSRASLLTLFVSAFWHGINPSYYLGFFIIHINIHIERIVFRNKRLRLFPKILYLFIFDYGHCVFKSYLIANTFVFLYSTKELLAFILLVYLIVKFCPPEKNTNKKVQ